MDLKALGEWLSGEIAVALHVSFWLAVFAVGFVIWRAMQWRYAGIIERLRDERDSMIRRETAKAAQVQMPRTPRRPTQYAQPEEEAGRAPAESHSPKFFVGEGTTPTFLKSLYLNNTTAQGERIVEPYVGKWMKVRGPVYDVQANADGSVNVNVDYSDPSDADRPLFERVTIVLLIFKNFEERLQIIHKGDVITANGKIAKVGRSSVILDHCELV